jgi:hypothetical protein
LGAEFFGDELLGGGESIGGGDFYAGLDANWKTRRTGWGCRM